jgi:putative alpha-1,2-mannosidase
MPNTIPRDLMTPDSSTREARGTLPDWLAYGFITPTFGRAASRAVDYAYNDFGLYQVSNGLGIGRIIGFGPRIHSLYTRV